ncbi:hypothetical protein J3F83DRAFT_320161 [Trichoderma novae-zelandiae]
MKVYRGGEKGEGKRRSRRRRRQSATLRYCRLFPPLDSSRFHLFDSMPILTFGLYLASLKIGMGIIGYEVGSSFSCMRRRHACFASFQRILVNWLLFLLFFVSRANTSVCSSLWRTGSLDALVSAYLRGFEVMGLFSFLFFFAKGLACVGCREGEMKYYYYWRCYCYFVGNVGGFHANKGYLFFTLRLKMGWFGSFFFMLMDGGIGYLYGGGRKVGL